MFGHASCRGRASGCRYSADVASTTVVSREPSHEERRSVRRNAILGTKLAIPPAGPRYLQKPQTLPYLGKRIYGFENTEFLK
jgi:hypothetical protein